MVVAMPTLEEIKAAARAYALGDTAATTTSNKPGYSWRTQKEAPVVSNEDYHSFVERLGLSADDEDDDEEEYPVDQEDDVDFNLLDVVDLEEELGWLEEEDMEAAVATLLDQPQLPQTPHQETSRHTQTATFEQFERLKALMRSHFTLLAQQMVLSVRAAHYQRLVKDRTDIVTGGESHDDLLELTNGAVGMLQDLDQNRKDAVRHYLSRSGHERLTRSQFSKTLAEVPCSTVFDIPGVARLNDLFTRIDESVEGSCETEDNVIEQIRPSDACAKLLKTVGSGVSPEMEKDLSECFVDAYDILGHSFQPPCSPDQSKILRKNKTVFTTGEDNLVLRGVNLYGERQWTLISDRFLPDRNDQIISQRHAKLSVLIFKANGVVIDAQGKLPPPPKYRSIDEVDGRQLSRIPRVDPPAILNVHRWSIAEDLTILRAVPILGTMWAELSNRLLPHRDRAHIRKRYEVLERRIKASVNREANLRRKRAESLAHTAVKKSSARGVPARPARLPPPQYMDNEAAAILARAREPKQSWVDRGRYHPPPMMAPPPNRSVAARDPMDPIHPGLLHDESRLAIERLVEGADTNLSALMKDENDVSNGDGFLGNMDTRFSVHDIKVPQNQNSVSFFHSVLEQSDSRMKTRRSSGQEKRAQPQDSFVSPRKATYRDPFHAPTPQGPDTLRSPLTPGTVPNDWKTEPSLFHPAASMGSFPADSRYHAHDVSPMPPDDSLALNDLEAVSALNSLSCSPTKLPEVPPPPANQPKRSLFDRVVGDSKKRRKSK